MGALLKALSGPTAAAAKRSGVFEEIKDRIDSAMFAQDLDDVERWLDANDHTFPPYWREHFNDMIEIRREEITAEDVRGILHSKYDF